MSGLDNSNCLKATLLKTDKTFYLTNLVALIKLLHYRPLSEKHQTTLEHSNETFVLEPVCAEVRNSGLQSCNFREAVLDRASSVKYFLEFSKF